MIEFNQIYRDGCGRLYCGRINKGTTFDLESTFDCGQCFRFNRTDENSFSGVAYGRSVRFYDEGDNVRIECDSAEDFALWCEFLDMERDYEQIIDALCDEELLYRIADYGRGIRILRQEPWEALCSFIISQNNNIPRIKGIIDRLCEGFGERLPGGDYTFPSAQRLSELTEQDLAPIRAGFRIRYILDAARKVAGGEIDLESLRTMPYDDAKAVLKTICGVGDKVANCVLLFGLGHVDAFPVDVWIKRIMDSKFPNGLPECANGNKGIIQQYLFYYYRAHANELETE